MRPASCLSRVNNASSPAPRLCEAILNSEGCAAAHKRGLENWVWAFLLRRGTTRGIRNGRACLPSPASTTGPSFRVGVHLIYTRLFLFREISSFLSKRCSSPLPLSSLTRCFDVDEVLANVLSSFSFFFVSFTFFKKGEGEES